MDSSKDMLINNSIDFNTMEKCDVSKSLFIQINWEEMLNAGIFLSQIDSQNKFDSIMENKNDLRNLCKLLIKLGDNCVSNISILQYIYTKIYEILTYENAMNHTDDGNTAGGTSTLIEMVSYFADSNNKVYDSNFIRAIHSTDKYIMSTCNYCYCILLANGQGQCGDGELRNYCIYLNEQLQSINMLEYLLTPLTIFLQKEMNRKCFLENHGIRLLSNLLSKLGPNGNAQYIYELVFSLWTISLCFSAPDTSMGVGVSVGDMSIENEYQSVDIKPFLSNGIIPIISELLAAVPSKKVIRMCVAVLRNLSSARDSDILTEMLNVGIDRQMESFLRNKTVSFDSDAESDSKHLYDVLLRNYRDLSAFDKWVSEVHSGALRWGIVHTEKFWRENSILLEQNDFCLLKLVISYLKSDNPVVVSIALYDLGEFSRFYPNGRSITKVLGGKDLVMSLIDSEDVDISRQALQCISKVMISNWDHMR